MDLCQKGSLATGNRLLRSVFDILVSVALSLGCWYTFFSMFDNPVNPIASVAFLTAVPALLYLLCGNKQIGKYIVFYVFLLIALVYLIWHEAVWNGFLVIANTIIETINTSTAGDLVMYKVSGTVAQWRVESMIAMFSVFLLVSLGIAHSTCHKVPILGFILTLIPVVIGICLGGKPGIIPFIVLALSWTGLLAVSSAYSTSGSGKRRVLTVFARGHNTFPYIFMGLVILILCLCFVIVPASEYQPFKAVDSAKSTIVSSAEHLRYDKLDGNNAEALSKGDLNDAHQLNYTDTTVLSLNEEIAEPMHLRAFVGGWYEDGKWQEYMDGAYAGSYAGVTEWLAQQGFYPWLQQDAIYRMSANYDVVEVDVENLELSSKYIYLPYEAALTGDTLPANTNYIKDYAALAKGLTGKRTYSFKSFVPRVSEYDEIAIEEFLDEAKKSSEWDRYAENEGIYRTFVYDTYLFMSNDSKSVLRSIDMKACKDKNIPYVLTWIRKYFEENYKYSIDVDASENDDQLSAFASGMQAGNDMHYATLATLMFRNAGIPARYAEGYYISPADVELYAETSNITMSVTDSQSHAWVEIYIDEFGWFPIEVVPGYYDISRHEVSSTEEREKTKKSSSKFYEDETPDVNEDENNDNQQHKFPMWVLAIVLVIVAILTFEILGRRRLRKRYERFRTSIDDGTVFEIYRFAEKLAKFDGHPIAADPYENVGELELLFEQANTGAYREFLDNMNRVRFGGISMTKEEQQTAAHFAEKLSTIVYARAGKLKRFIMKYVLFYV